MYYLRQHRYLYPYTQTTKPIGKNYILCDEQYNYVDLNHLHDEFFKYFFNDIDDARKALVDLKTHDLSELFKPDGSINMQKLKEPLDLLRELYYNKFDDKASQNVNLPYISTSMFRFWSLILDIMDNPKHIDDYEIQINLKEQNIDVLDLARQSRPCTSLMLYKDEK